MSGILGIYNANDAAKLMFYGLHTLQHRGQEGSGMITSDSQTMYGYKNHGMVQRSFNEATLLQLKGTMAIGHVYHPTKERRVLQNIQPFLFHHSLGDFAVCHHGDIVNAQAIRHYLEKRGSIFQSDSDSELLAHLINTHRQKKTLDSIKEALNYIEGSFAFLYMTKDELYIMRDRFGLATLSIGSLGDGYVVSSETCAFESIGAKYLRDVSPGEIIVLSKNGLQSITHASHTHQAINAMEFIYYSRPDSNIEGINVHQVRKKTGIILAQEAPSPADIVVGVPDSSISAAYGYAEASGLPYEMGLIKNRYVGQAFATSNQRQSNVKLKLSPVRSVIAGKRIALIDDSIIRGTTAKNIVKIMRDAGAKEIHVRIASPEIISPQLYGLDTYHNDDLISLRLNKEKLCQEIAADSLEFLSVDGLKRAVGECGLYVGCFNREYPTHIYESEVA